MSELAYSSAIAIAKMIRQRELSSREALDYFLARVAALDKPINSVVTIDADRARTEADAADAALARGEVRGPLHGVPITIKDSFQTAGMRTTSGAPELAGFIPHEDAWPVARLREAGAIIFGKTNLPIYAGDLQSYNEVFGTTNNPYDVSRTPGGSSGGSAAALACGFTPLELGSDIGGSIRLPSHMSGVVGHKPSYGIVPAHGQIPGPPGTLTLADLAVAGPMARAVEDLKLGLEIMSGPNRWEHPAWRLKLPPPRHRTLKGYRIAAWLDDPRCRVEPDSRELLEKAAADARFRRCTDRSRGAAGLHSGKGGRYLLRPAPGRPRRRSQRDRIEDYATATGDTPVARTSGSSRCAIAQWLSYNERRLQMRKRWEEFFAKWDAILLPVMPCPAIPHDHSEPMASRTVTSTATAFLLGPDHLDGAGGRMLLACHRCSCRRLANGLPVGIQIVGPYLADLTTLDLAARLSAICGGCPRPPGF